MTDVVLFRIIKGKDMEYTIKEFLHKFDDPNR